MMRHRFATLVVGLASVLAVAALAPAGASAQRIYNDYPHHTPGNWPSIGNEAYSVSELGSRVKFGGRSRYATWLTVGLSSWACEEGSWYAGDCESEPGSAYYMPLIFNIYSVGPGGSVGPLLYTLEEPVWLPYRPSASRRCTGEQAGDWYDARERRCYDGKAYKAKIYLVERLVPDEAIISVQYNTTDAGPKPIGEAPCHSTPAGCFYDSLNIGLVEVANSYRPVGSNPAPNELYANTLNSEIDCGSSANLGTFGPTGACWEGMQMAIRLTANSRERAE